MKKTFIVIMVTICFCTTIAFVVTNTPGDSETAKFTQEMSDSTNYVIFLTSDEALAVKGGACSYCKAYTCGTNGSTCFPEPDDPGCVPLAGQCGSITSVWDYSACAFKDDPQALCTQREGGVIENQAFCNCVPDPLQGFVCFPLTFGNSGCPYYETSCA